MNTLYKASVRALVAVAASALLAPSCVSTERETSTPSRSPRAEYTPPSGKGQRVSGATVLNTVQAAHAFSSPGTPDKFLLQLRGPRILTGQLHFVVLSAQGDTLHQEVLPARVLQDPQALTVRDQEISVLRGMNGFFSPARFAPAPASPAAVVFEYPAADGTPHQLVYSPKLGRAVVQAE